MEESPEIVPELQDGQDVATSYRPHLRAPSTRPRTQSVKRTMLRRRIEERLREPSTNRDADAGISSSAYNAESDSFRAALRKRIRKDQSNIEAPNDDMWQSVTVGQDSDRESIPFSPPGVPGPVVPLDVLESNREIDYFNLLMSNEILTDIVNETNRYAETNVRNKRQSTGTDENVDYSSWQPVTLLEFRRFLGVIFNMGVIQLPAIQDYLRVDWYCNVPFLGLFMNRSRFKNLAS